MLTLSDLRLENYELLDSDESEANENDGCDLNEDVIACQYMNLNFTLWLENKSIAWLLIFIIKTKNFINFFKT